MPGLAIVKLRFPLGWHLEPPGGVLPLEVRVWLKRVELPRQRSSSILACGAVLNDPVLRNLSRNRPLMMPSSGARTPRQSRSPKGILA